MNNVHRLVDIPQYRIDVAGSARANAAMNAGTRPRRFGPALIALCVCVHPVAAVELSTLLPSGSLSTEDAFGFASAASMTRYAVAAPGENNARGAVYVFDCGVEACALDAKLVVAGLAEGARFGSAIALEGDRLAVAAPTSGIGEVFVYTRGVNGWTDPPQIIPGQVFGSGGRFGVSLALSVDTLVVGADDQEGLRGVAYVWRELAGKWTPEQTLRPNDRVGGDRFGSAVALSGDTALVASPYAKAGTGNSSYARGEVAVFTRSGAVWTRTQVLRAVTAATRNRFGFALDLDGDHAVIGAPGADDGDGRVYAYARSAGTYSPQSDWAPANAHGGDQFGWSIALSGERLLVSAPFSGFAIDECGRVESYRRVGAAYVPTGALLTRTTHETALFGWSLALGTPGEFATTPTPINGTGLAHHYNAAESMFDDAFEIPLGPCFAPDIVP